MAGYWKIEKEWVQRWGLTASEAIVLADILSWDGINNRGCTLKERAERCCLTVPGLIKILKKIITKLGGDSKQSLPSDSKQSLPQRVNKVYQTWLTKFTADSKQSLLPPTPPNNVEEHNEELLKNNGRNARAGEEANLLRVFCDFYRSKTGTRYVPDWRTQSADYSALCDIVRGKATEHGIVWTEYSAEKFFGDMLEAMWQHMDEWQRSHFSLRTLVSQFNQLYNQVINPQKATNNGRQQQRNAGLSDEFLAGIARDLASGK